MANLTPYQSSIATYAAQFSVPESWIKAVIMTESSGNPRAFRAEPKINDGSYGLMQLLLRTARGLGFTGESAQLFDPDTNIRYGTQLLADLRRRFGANFQRVYSAYNSGNPDLYLTSAQVKLNVDRASGWLKTFFVVAPPVALVALALGAYALSRG